MALAYNSRSTHPTGGTGNLSWTVTVPVGCKAAFVSIHQITGATNEVTGVTLGGVSMSAVTPGSPILHATGETGGEYLYFLGADIPTGDQTCAITVNATGSNKGPVCLLWTGASNTEIVDSDSSAADSSDGPSIALSFGGRTCAVILVGRSGEDAVADTSPSSGWTFQGETDLGSTIAIESTYDTVGSTDVTASWVQTGNDHWAIAAAFSEVIAETALGAGTIVAQSGVLAADATGQSDGAATLADQASGLASAGTVYVYPAYGHATPDAGEAAQSWSTWHLGAGAAITGDADYGNLTMPSGVVCDGPVVDMGSIASRQITLDTKYGTTLGSVTMYLRGSDSSFAWDALAPIWTVYTGTVIQAWRYVQARIVGA